MHGGIQKKVVLDLIKYKLQQIKSKLLYVQTVIDAQFIFIAIWFGFTPCPRLMVGFKLKHISLVYVYI